MKICRSLILAGMLTLCVGVDDTACAQLTLIPAPDREQRFGPNRISLDVSVLGASLGYSRQLSPTVEWGLAVAGGAQAGFMLPSGELTGDGFAPLFVELLGGSAFIRGDVASRTELEGGVRIGWFYHTTEYETVFRGIYTAVQYRIRAVHVGPRIYWGRLSEETGRTQFALAVIPLTLGLRWSW